MARTRLGTRWSRVPALAGGRATSLGPTNLLSPAPSTGRGCCRSSASQRARRRGRPRRGLRACCLSIAIEVLITRPVPPSSSYHRTLEPLPLTSPPREKKATPYAIFRGDSDLSRAAEPASRRTGPLAGRSGGRWRFEPRWRSGASTGAWHEMQRQPLDDAFSAREGSMTGKDSPSMTAPHDL